MNAHPFRPGADRARCADCSLGADQHALETLLEASIDATTNRVGIFEGARRMPSSVLVAPAPLPKRRGRPPGPQPATRAERIRLGLPTCNTPTCHRAPRRGRVGSWRLLYCPRCASATARTRTKIGPSTYLGLKVPVALFERASGAASDQSVSLAEWVRRAIGEALERQTPASSGS